MVCMGKVKGTRVAVKTVKPNTERDVLISLLAEIKIMSHLEGHPHIVELVGANTDGIASGKNNNYCALADTEFADPCHRAVTPCLSFVIRSSIHFCRVLSIRKFGVVPKKEQEVASVPC
jgi:serine/threonine protein kinase